MIQREKIPISAINHMCINSNEMPKHQPPIFSKTRSNALFFHSVGLYGQTYAEKSQHKRALRFFSVFIFF